MVNVAFGRRHSSVCHWNATATANRNGAESRYGKFMGNALGELNQRSKQSPRPDGIIFPPSHCRKRCKSQCASGNASTDRLLTDELCSCGSQIAADSPMFARGKITIADVISGAGWQPADRNCTVAIFGLPCATQYPSKPINAHSAFSAHRFSVPDAVPGIHARSRGRPTKRFCLCRCPILSARQFRPMCKGHRSFFA